MYKNQRLINRDPVYSLEMERLYAEWEAKVDAAIDAIGELLEPSEPGITEVMKSELHIDDAMAGLLIANRVAEMLDRDFPLPEEVIPLLQPGRYGDQFFFGEKKRNIIAHFSARGIDIPQSKPIRNS